MTPITQDVHFEEMKGAHHSIGVITLNRPAVLNSLSHDMIRAIMVQLKHWARDDALQAVVIKACEGRAFCAGGDLRLTYERAVAKDVARTSFFQDEYELNRLIFHYKKPYIAFLNGITMGGGVGLSMHGSHRVATDRLLFAMPETGIGFFPDVGGTYFLPRITHEIGTYLGLTGARITVDDARLLGLVTHKVAEEAFPSIINDLLSTPLYASHAKETVTELLDKHAQEVKTSQLMALKDDLNAAFHHNSIEAILTAIKFTGHAFLEAAADMLKKKSPTSLKVTLRALREGGVMDFDACMKQEFRLVEHFLNGHDFIEGIRALIIDKDQSPHWQPADLAHVTDEMVLAYFKDSDATWVSPWK